jgi:hypothetical protein
MNSTALLVAFALIAGSVLFAMIVIAVGARSARRHPLMFAIETETARLEELRAKRYKRGTESGNVSREKA